MIHKGFTWNPANLTRTTKQKSIERFWSNVEKSAECWRWMGLKDKDGYGRHRPGTGTAYMKAHRFSWLIHEGEIPPKLSVLHRCDKPDCVRPDHLFLGTHQDNMDDMVRKGRQARGERHARWRRLAETQGQEGG
jgi:hypothetical protein